MNSSKELFPKNLKVIETLFLFLRMLISAGTASFKFFSSSKSLSKDEEDEEVVGDAVCLFTSCSTCLAESRSFIILLESRFCSE